MEQIRKVNRQKDMEQGKQWEDTPKQWQLNNGFTLQPYDVDQDIKHHVDFIAQKPDGEKTRVIIADVKADKNIGTTGNVIFEQFSDWLTQYPGWGIDETVKAEYIFIVDVANRAENKPFYILRQADMRKYWDANKRSLLLYTHKEIDVITGKLKAPTIALLPLHRQAEQYGYWYVDSNRKCKFIGDKDSHFWQVGKLE